MKIQTTKKNIRKRLAFMLVICMVLTSLAGIAPTSTTVSKAAVDSQGIITGGEGSFTTTLSNGEATELTVTDCKLTVKVGSKTYSFRNNLTIVGMAVINVPDDLLHIFTLSGKYYCMDLRSGVVIEAYRNAGNGKYCLKTNTSGYEVFGSSIINTSYFYEYVSANSVSREKLITRGEFDWISEGKDPSVDTIPTATPTVKPDDPTPTPTVRPDDPTPTPTVRPDDPIPTPTVRPDDPTSTPTQTPNGNCNGNCGCGCDSNCNGSCCNGNCNCNGSQKPNGGVTGDNVNNADVNASGNGNTITINQSISNTTINGNGNSAGTGVNAPVPVVTKPAAKTTTSSVKSKSYYAAIKSGNRLKLYKVTQKVSGGKIKTTRKWLSICLFDRKKGRMDWNSYRIKGVKKCQYSAKKHWIVIITKKGVVKACPSGKGTKSVKTIGRGAKAFKCNSRGLATSYVKKNGKVVKLAY